MDEPYPYVIKCMGPGPRFSFAYYRALWNAKDSPGPTHTTKPLATPLYTINHLRVIRVQISKHFEKGTFSQIPSHIPLFWTLNTTLPILCIFITGRNFCLKRH